MDSQNLLFIIGNPRSGTSLFRIMLTNHSDICVPPECGFIHWWSAKYGNWSKKDNTAQSISNFINDLKTSKKIETWNLNFDELKVSVLNKQPQDYATLCKLVIKFYARPLSSTLKYLGDKNNYYISHLDELYKISKSAKFLFITRDGRDVACSYKNIKKVKSNSPYKPNLPCSIESIANEWSTNLYIIESFKNKLNTDQKYSIRYEDLLTNTENTLQTICDFLNIEFDENMLSYADNNKKRRQEPEELMAWKLKTYQKPDTSNIGKYKLELSRDEISTFEKIAGNALKLNNYKLEDEA